MADVHMTSPTLPNTLPQKRKLNQLNAVYNCLDKTGDPLDSIYLVLRDALEAVTELSKEKFTRKESEVLGAVQKQQQVLIQRRNQLAEDMRMMIHYMSTLANVIDRCHDLEF